MSLPTPKGKWPTCLYILVSFPVHSFAINRLTIIVIFALLPNGTKVFIMRYSLIFEQEFLSKLRDRFLVYFREITNKM